MADALERVDIGLAHGHDLALEANLHAVERHGLGGRILDLEIGAAGQGANMGEDVFDCVRGTGDSAVDAFASEQQRALDVIRVAQLNQRLAQGGGVRETGETVQRGHADGWRQVGHAARYYGRGPFVKIPLLRRACRDTILVSPGAHES